MFVQNNTAPTRLTLQAFYYYNILQTNKYFRILINTALFVRHIFSKLRLAIRNKCKFCQEVTWGGSQKTGRWRWIRLKVASWVAGALYSFVPYRSSRSSTTWSNMYCDWFLLGSPITTFESDLIVRGGSDLQVRMNRNEPRISLPTRAYYTERICTCDEDFFKVSTSTYITTICSNATT